MGTFSLLIVFCGGIFLDSAAIDTTVCDSNTCYQNVNNSLRDLVDLINTLNSTTSSANVPKLYDFKNLNDDVKKLKNIKNLAKNIKSGLAASIKSVNETEQNLLEDRGRVDEMSEKLSKFYNNSAKKLLDNAKNNLTKFEELFDFAQNASKACQQKGNRSSELEKILENITKSYDDTTKRANEINNNLNKTFQKTVTLKNKVDNLNLPTDLVGGYISQVETNFNRTLNLLKNNTNLLKELLSASQKQFNDRINQNGQNIKDNIEAIRKDLDGMNKNLTPYEQLLNKTLNQGPKGNETDSGLLTTDFCDSNNLADLKDKADLFGDELPSKATEFCERKKQAEILLKEHNLVLDAVPTKVQLKNFEIELKQLRITISLLEELDRLRRKLERLRKNRDEILQINCNIGNSGLLQRK